MNNKMNLSKLIEEIENEKAKKVSNKTTNDVISNAIANNNRNNTNSRQVFLNNLIESLNTGKKTVSTELIKKIDNISNGIKNNNNLKITNNNLNVNEFENSTINDDINEFDDRELKFYNDLKNYKNKKLTNNNKINENIINENVLNERVLNEKVQEIVDNIILDKLGLILEESIKNIIVEMFATEKIKEVIFENKEYIKDVVIETIREIQMKNKNMKK